MSLQMISPILIFLIKLLSDFPAYVSSSAPECSPIITTPGCPTDYVETPHPRACVMATKTKQNYAKSKEYCEKLEKHYSSLWVSYNQEQTDQVADLVLLTGEPANKQNFYVHIGLACKQGACGKAWLNGQKVRSSSKNWDAKQPNGQGNRQEAGAVNMLGKWHDVNTPDDYPALCMTRHQIGPREFGMSMVYHDLKRGPTVIYKGRDVFFTCTVFIPASDINFVSIHDMYGSNFAMVSRSNVSAKNSLGLCTNKASIEVKAVRGYRPAVREIDTYRTVQCYARPWDTYDEVVECNNKPNEFCKKFTFPMKLLDPPIEKPILKIDIKGKEARIECEVNVGLSGKLTWVLFFKNSTIEFIQDNDPRIQDETRVANDSRWIEQATLVLDYGELKGIRVACFDHSITKHNLNSTCVADDLYCDIKILEPKDTGAKDDTETNGLGIVTLLSIPIAGGILGLLLFALTMKKGEKRVITQEAEKVQRESQLGRSSRTSETIARGSQVDRPSRASGNIARESQEGQRSSQDGQRASLEVEVVRGSADETD